jgi:hypothetical protein
MVGMVGTLPLCLPYELGDANCFALLARAISTHDCDKSTRRANQAKSLSSPFCKNIPLNVSGKSVV